MRYPLTSRLLAPLILAALPQAAAAGCAVPPPGTPQAVQLLAYRFPVMERYAEVMEECGNVDGLDVEAKLVPFQQLLDQTGIALASGGDVPFQILGAYRPMLVEFAAKGWLEPVDDLLDSSREAYGLDDMPPALWDAVTYDGQRFGIPFGQNVQILYYRKDLFAELGLEPPRTYDEWIAAAEALQAQGQVDYPLALSFERPTGAAMEFENALMVQGGTWFAEDGSAGFNSPEGLRALEVLARLYALAPPGAVAATNADVALALQQGQVATASLWFSRAASMDDPEQSRVLGQIDFAPAVSATVGGVPHASWSQDMFVFPRHSGVDLALSFQIVAEATSRDSQAAIAAVGLMPRESILRDPALRNRAVSAAEETIARGTRLPPSVPYMQAIYAIVGQHVADALEGQVTAQEALDAAAAEVDERLREEGVLQAN